MHFEISCDDVLTRLSSLFGTKTDVELASKLGVASQTVSTWRGRNRVPYEQLAEVSSQNEVSLDFLIFGRGKPQNLHFGGQIDAELFKSVINALNAPASELRGIRLEHLLDHVITVYNSLTQCESQSEKDRMLHAQIQLLNKLVAPHIVENLKSMEPQMEGEQKASIRKDIEAYEKLASSQVTTTQHISGAHHQIAGRDVVNKDKS